jgi:hypothetical protein
MSAGRCATLSFLCAIALAAGVALPSAAGADGGNCSAFLAENVPCPFDSPPYAHVIAPSGTEVYRFGSAYADDPAQGGQVQEAINYAHQHGDPQVELDSGTYVTHASLATSGSGPGIQAGFFLYSGVTLSGSTSSPSALTAALGLDSLVVVGTGPTQLNTPAPEVNISNVTLDGTGQSVNDGLIVGATSGAGAVNSVTVRNVGTGLVVGYPFGNLGGPVNASGGQAFDVWNNVVGPVRSDGIEVDGQNIDVAYNSVRSAHSGNAITSFVSTSNTTIHDNTICCTAVGIGLDGSSPGSPPGDQDVGNDNSSTEAGFGQSITVSNNTIQDTCQGITLFRQKSDYVHGNQVFNDNATLTPNEPDGTPQQRGSACSGTLGNVPDNTVGLLVSDAHDNYLYGNTVNNGNNGGFNVWLWANGGSPTGTAYNGVGVYYDPSTGGFPIDGNTLYNGQRPMVVNQQRATTPSGTQPDTYDNTIDNNQGQYAALPCYYDPATNTTGSGNTGGC